MNDPADVYDPIGGQPNMPQSSAPQSPPQSSPPPPPPTCGGMSPPPPPPTHSSPAPPPMPQQQNAQSGAQGGGTLPPGGKYVPKVRTPRHPPGSPADVIERHMEEAIKEMLNGGYSMQDCMDHFYDHFKAYVDYHDQIYGTGSIPVSTP